MNPGTWCHSQSDRYHGEFASKEAAIEDGIEFYEGEPFSVGQQVHPMDMVSIPVDYLIEQIECHLYDQIGFEDQIVELTKEKHEALAAIIEDYLRREATFNSGGVMHIEKIYPGGSQPE